ncbi:GD14790 [Drosophila simulans]|uniref:GD14790 n=1 Tax=Drosophila simulans TaxID=7240 RepID=B4QQD6_DROSI|nr:GD14790 [Drosophila simulans]
MKCWAKREPQIAAECIFQKTKPERRMQSQVVISEALWTSDSANYNARDGKRSPQKQQEEGEEQEQELEEQDNEQD